MSVLFSELLMPGWAESGEKIGLGDVTGTYDSAIAFTLPCHSADPELFFSEDEIKVAEAKSLCGGCPVRKQCLEGALSRQEPVGVWGGELFEDGKVIARKRKAGRPRIDQVATAVVLESVSSIELESEREESAAQVANYQFAADPVIKRNHWAVVRVITGLYIERESRSAIIKD